MIISSKVRCKINEFIGANVYFDENTKIKDLDLDSLDIADLLVVLSNEYNIELKESDLQKSTIKTVGDLQSIFTKKT